MYRKRTCYLFVLLYVCVCVCVSSGRGRDAHTLVKRTRVVSRISVMVKRNVSKSRFFHVFHRMFTHIQEADRRFNDINTSARTKLLFFIFIQL